MTKTLNNPETGKSFTVYVHQFFVQHGEVRAQVNKGDAPSKMTFYVPAAWLTA